MKKTAVLAFIGATLGVAMAIGVPGVSAEQQAHAFTPCTNSLTCNPANMPMLVEGGFIKIGADGLVKTGVIAPKAPPSSPWAAVDWLGAVVGTVGTAIAAWSIKTGMDFFGQDSEVDGELMTNEGVPEGRLETETGYEFDAGGSAGDRCKRASLVHMTYDALPPTTCEPSLSFAGGIQIDWALSPLVNNSITANTTVTLSGSTVYEASIRYAYRVPTVEPDVVGAVRWSSKRDLAVGTSSTVLTLTASQPIVGVAISIGGPVYLVWSAKGPAPETAPKTQLGTVERTLDCRDTAGLVQTVTGTTRGTMGLPGGLTMAPLKCPPGYLPIDTGTIWKPETGNPMTIIPKRHVVPKPITELEKFPDCWDGKCIVTLEKVNGESCGKVGENCPDWSRDPKRSQNYLCKFGGKLVNLNMCSMYRSPDHGVLPNVDKDTGEYLDPSAPVPKDFGKPVTNPKTGAPMTQVPVNNQPQKDCRPQSFWEILNPFNVFQAVGCAMKEAFVPKEENIKAMQGRINQQWTKTSVAQVSMAVNSLMDLPTVGAGCTGPPMRINMAGFGVDETFYPFNACSEPMAGVAATVKNIGGFLVVAGGLLAMLRYSARIINYDGFGKHDGSHESGVKFK